MRPIGPSHIVVLVVLLVLLVLAGVGGVRWARQYSAGAQMMASVMLLVLGLTVPIVQPPQQQIEEARESKGKMGRELPDEPGPDSA